MAFFIRNFGQKTPHMVFFPPCPIQPKGYVAQIVSNPTLLTRSFWLVF